MHHCVRIPMALTPLAIETASQGFLHNATESSLDLKKIRPTLDSVAKHIKKRYLATLESAPKILPTDFHVIQSSLSINAGKTSKLCHAISTFLYCIESTDGMAHFRKIVTVPWKIEFSLNNLGQPSAVTVTSLDAKLMTVAFVQEYNAMLEKAYEFEPLCCSATVSPALDL